MKRKYLILCLLSFFPQLHGCLWQELHIKGEVDASGEPIAEKEEKTIEELKL